MNSSEQLKNNYQSTNNQVSPLYGLRKDHTKCDNDVDGPPTPPVCSANIASNHRISHFLSMILCPFIDSATTTSDSTEDLLSRIKDGIAM